MTFGLFVELDLGQSDGPWGFVAPEHLKKQLAQKLRCEDGSSKVHVKKDAIQMGEELQVRVLANSAMSTLAMFELWFALRFFFGTEKDGHVTWNMSYLGEASSFQKSCSNGTVSTSMFV